MGRERFSLETIEVTSPCSVPWDGMQGCDRVRYCDQCQLAVHDLSGMVRAEAEALVLRNEGSLCVRFRRQNDGTVLTRDDPARAAPGWLPRGLVAALSFVLALFFGPAESRGAAPPPRKNEPTPPFLKPNIDLIRKSEVTLGRLRMPPRPAALPLPPGPTKKGAPPKP